MFAKFKLCLKSLKKCDIKSLIYVSLSICQSWKLTSHTQLIDKIVFKEECHLTSCIDVAADVKSKRWFGVIPGSLVKES